MPLKLLANVTGYNTSVTCKWSVFLQESGRSFTELNASSFALTSTSVHFPASATSLGFDFPLVVNLLSDEFYPGRLYVFRLDVLPDGGGISLSDNVTVAVNIPPRDGELVIYPQYGYAATTVFNISALDWISPTGAYPLYIPAHSIFVSPTTWLFEHC